MRVFIKSFPSLGVLRIECRIKFAYDKNCSLLLNFVVLQSIIKMKIKDNSGLSVSDG